MGSIEYPNPSHLLTEISPRLRLPHGRPSIPPRSAVVVVTRDHVDRLRTTLPRIAGGHCPVILLDDSTNALARGRCMRLAKRLDIAYHGLREQRSVLSGVSPSLIEGLVAQLGTPGWTLGLCRNYSLLLARYMGIEKLILVDDDITLPSQHMLARTLNLLGDFDFAGAKTVGLADDSVVGHLARRLGIVQYDFVTGQYLGVRCRLQRSFFPNEYNEDLVFLLLGANQGRIARCGTVRQLHRGHAGMGVERALSQEAGEIHCEGCIRAAIEGTPAALQESGFWKAILAFRVRALRDLLARDRDWGGNESSHLLSQVISRASSFPPSGFAQFYRNYFATVPRWIDLQEALS